MRIVFSSLAALFLSAGCGAADPGAQPQTSPNASASADEVAAATSPAHDVLIEGADPGLIDQGAWWSWAGSKPIGSGPVEDETGEACATNQGSEVWFLAGTYGGRIERSCDIPAGMPIVFPIVNTAGGAGSCDGFLEDASGTATLDGMDVQVHEMPVEELTIDLVNGNAAFGDGGRFSVTGCGLWVALEALSAGAHLVEFEGASGGYATAATYARSRRR
ncbi:hypothetical protein [Glycomyces lechevalierae]|uniref:Lipoprotein n=2 Tax=Glycomyces TaxID=58113 RepID=A0A9X3SXM9_9ACTN|nr:hypothetical protein [Glycomyces lechevalierae]MDA1387137.1 hypothetical protein [Glycomyces lechevalierae]MDR7336722.1 hypothetical protein [Glycomyces lechevalierae]